MELKPQFSNNNSWSSIGSGSVSAVKLSTPVDAYNPIPPITISTLVDVPTIACFTSSSEAPSTWMCGGWLSANIVSGLTVGGNSDAEIGRETLRLNRINIIRFPQLSSTYSLKLYVPKWFRQITYNVWCYTGSGVPDIEGKLDQIALTINP